MRDLNSRLSVAPSLLAQRVGSAAVTIDGGDVDLANFDSAVVVLEAGTWVTAGTYTFNVQEADDDGAGAPGAYTNVVAADLDGTELAVTSAANDNAVAQIGYKGNKRWLRVQMITTGTTGTFDLAASVIRGNGRKLT